MLEDLDKPELIELIQKLEKENKELKEKLYGFNKKSETIEENTKNNISNEEKVKLFMSIFKARTDVYAKRWTSNKTGKSGYSPVCRNEFSKYKCDKFNVKCSECVHRELEPVTEENEDEIPKKTKVRDTIFTNNIECIFDNQIYVKKLKLLPNERTYLKRLASFTNPRFYELQKLRMPYIIHLE